MSASLASNPWIGFHHARPSAQSRLFCFPYAGAGASVFRTWPALLSRSVEICGMQYPGREQRVDEPYCTDILVLAETLAAELAPYLTTRFAFFGHSLGALVAYEVTRILRDRHLPMPARLFISGRHAPHLASRHNPLHRLPDPQFIACMRQFNALPVEVFGNSELLSLLVPILKADFAMGENYIYVDGPPLTVPMSVFAGPGDPGISPEDLTAWRELAAGPFEWKQFPGGHLFLHSRRRELIETIVGSLKIHAPAALP